MNISKWAFVYSQDQFDEANTIHEQLKYISSTRNFNLHEPQWVELTNNDSA